MAYSPSGNVALAVADGGGGDGVVGAGDGVVGPGDGDALLLAVGDALLLTDGEALAVDVALAVGPAGAVAPG